MDRRYLNAALDQRHPEALYDVGHYHLEGSDGRERSVTLALAYFEAAGDAGHPDALCSAGAMYFKGIGTAEVSVVPLCSCVA